MPAAHHGLTPYRYEGHGHSIWSDGRDTPGAIVAAAIKQNTQIIGLSDHDTVDGLPAFIDACHRANQAGHHILPIPSVEISTTMGDLLVALPFPASAKAFIHSFPQWKKPAHPLQVIEESILRYHAVCVFLHPEAPYLHGFTRHGITEIHRKLSRQLHRYMGIEIHNWMTQIFFWNRQRKQKDLQMCNQQQWDLAEFAFSDYHRARHVGKNATTLYLRSLTPASFVEAFSTRQTRLEQSPPSFGDFIDAAATSIQADLF